MRAGRGLAHRCIVERSLATPSPQSGMITMRPTQIPAAVSGWSCPLAGMRERAAPRRIRLMGTAAAPSLPIPR